MSRFLRGRVMEKLWDDSNWREESIPYYTGKQLELLMDGPKSLAQSWQMGAMYNESVSYTHLTLPTNREV